jgi:hypothetical protein
LAPVRLEVGSHDLGQRLLLLPEHGFRRDHLFRAVLELQRQGYYIIGGTSAASPQLAGVVALANQVRQQEGKQPIGYLNPVLYQLPASAFNDTVLLTFGTGAGVTTLDSNQQYGTRIQGPLFVAGLAAAP